MNLDWTNWHSEYYRQPAFQARLKGVQEEVAAFLDASDAGPIRIVSICAGDGRDVIPVVAAHPRKSDLQIWLIDTDAPSLQRGSRLAGEYGIRELVHLVVADAGLAATYRGVVPADLLIVSGLLGHLVTNDSRNLVQRLPALCRSGGSVIWSRRNQDMGIPHIPMIRKELLDLGFRELSFEETFPDEFVVGHSRLEGETSTLDPDEVLFRFLGHDNIYKRETLLGVLNFENYCWHGSRESPFSKHQIELLIDGDDSGPDETQIALLENYFHGHWLETCRSLLNPFTAWSFHPTRLMISNNSRVEISFESSLAFLASRAVEDHRYGNDHSDRLRRAS